MEHTRSNFPPKKNQDEFSICKENDCRYHERTRNIASVDENLSTQPYGKNSNPHGRKKNKPKLKTEVCEQ